MGRFQVEIQVIAALVAVGCALSGVFLVLRRMALISDAISHSILFGIVLAYFLTQDLSSPLLFFGAVLSGVLTVGLVGLLQRSGLIRNDAAIGIVFSVLFSAGVVIVSRYISSAHLDVDAVLRGDLVLSVIDRRVEWGGVDFGPQAMYVMAVILTLNVAFVAVFYKELKLSTFDPALAAALGFAPGLLHYALMTLVSVTAVGAFDAVGSVLVVALMIGPPATAYLLTDRLSRMLFLSAGLGVVTAMTGYWLSVWMDVSVAGMMATMTGLLFLAVFLVAPERGVVALLLRRARQRWEFAVTMLAIHLFHHEGRPEYDAEAKISNLPEHLRWQPAFVDRVVRLAEQAEFVTEDEGRLQLTNAGRERARRAVVS